MHIQSKKLMKLDRFLLAFFTGVALFLCLSCTSTDEVGIMRPITQNCTTKDREVEKLVDDILDPAYVMYHPVIHEKAFDDMVRDICWKYPNVNQFLIHSIIYHESRYDSTAKNGSCIGLMQMSTRWHTGRAQSLGLSGDLYDPYTNVYTGVDYLNDLIESYGDISLVLMIYNGQANAYERFQTGDISWYARSVMEMANELEVKYYAEKEVGCGAN